MSSQQSKSPLAQASVLRCSGEMKVPGCTVTAGCTAMATLTGAELSMGTSVLGPLAGGGAATDSTNSNNFNWLDNWQFKTGQIENYSEVMRCPFHWCSPKWKKKWKRKTFFSSRKKFLTHMIRLSLIDTILKAYTIHKTFLSYSIAYLFLHFWDLQIAAAYAEVLLNFGVYDRK